MPQSPIPRLRAQLEVQKPDAGYPSFGRDELDHGHAIYSIGVALRSLGLSTWLTTVLLWLERYDGLEVHVEEEFDPAVCVRQLLLDHVVRLSCGGLKLNQADLRQTITRELMQLEFVRYRAQWGNFPSARIVWNPLEQSWLSFRSLGREYEDLSVWRTDMCQSHRNRMSQFLLQGVSGFGPAHEGC